MANITTVCRPYAKAILALAKEHDEYTVWSSMLQFLAAVANDPLGYKVLSNLAISSRDKAEFICQVAGDILNTEGKNLIKVLAHSKRLLILPELSRLYDEMRKVAQGIIEVDLTLAQAVDQTELNKIQTICKQSIAGQVELTEEVNADLISGGVAKIGNRVIDASILGRLRAMQNLLKQ
jgi:F-type H+-transporting ATPase subunit delta